MPKTATVTKPEQEPDEAPSRWMSGFCQSGLHERCPGAAVRGLNVIAKAKTKAGRARLLLCAHPWHEGQPVKCLNCGRAGQPVTDDRECVDFEDCVDFQIKRTESNPIVVLVRECVAAGEQERAAKALRRAEERPKGLDGAENTGEAPNSEERPRRAREPRPPRPTSGTCVHCGEPTKGGLFVAGHDAKLKGLLLAAAKTGDAQALAEMQMRNWVKPSHAFPAKQVKTATGISSHANAADWLAKRVAERTGR